MEHGTIAPTSSIRERPQNRNCNTCLVSYIVLKVQRNGAADIWLRASRNQPLRQITRKYCEITGLDYDNVRFTANGKKVEESKTPEELKMQEEDVIDAFTEQIGAKRRKVRCPYEDLIELSSDSEEQTMSFSNPSCRSIKEEATSLPCPSEDLIELSSDSEEQTMSFSNPSCPSIKEGATILPCPFSPSTEIVDDDVYPLGNDVVETSTPCKSRRTTRASKGKRRVIESESVKSPFLYTLDSTASIKSSVKRLLDASIDSGDVVCQIGSEHINKEELLTLMPGCGVRDTVVHIFCKLFNSRNAGNSKNAKKLYIDPFTTIKIVTNKNFKDMDTVMERLCRPIHKSFDTTDIAFAEMIFFPICYSNHWLVYVINIRDERLDVLDCRNITRRYPKHSRFFNNLLKTVGYLLRKVKHKKADGIESLEKELGEVPKSHTETDCGLWTIAYMELWDGRMTSQLHTEAVEEYRLNYIATLLETDYNLHAQKFIT